MCFFSRNRNEISKHSPHLPIPFAQIIIFVESTSSSLAEIQSQVIAQIPSANQMCLEYPHPLAHHLHFHPSPTAPVHKDIPIPHPILPLSFCINTLGLRPTVSFPVPVPPFCLILSTPHPHLTPTAPFLDRVAADVSDGVSGVSGSQRVAANRTGFVSAQPAVNTGEVENVFARRKLSEGVSRFVFRKADATSAEWQKLAEMKEEC